MASSSSSSSSDSQLEHGDSDYVRCLGGWTAVAFGSKADSSALVYDSESSDSKSVDIEAAPPTAAAPEPKCYVQPTLTRPEDMPSDHPELAHDWSAWPTFPAAKKNKAKQRAVPPPASAPAHIKHFNSHEFPPEMELLTSPKGTLLQPAPSFRFTNLDEECQYTAWLTFTDVDGAKCEAQYQHPASPSPGSSWNRKVITFDHVKLYSDDGSGRPQASVTLKTGKRYRLQINVGCVDDSGYTLGETVVRQFIATTFVVVDKRSSAERGRRSI
ncbi:hypothetical protein MTO96_008463 [Rhipicephalus appendiculatus]